MSTLPRFCKSLGARDAAEYKAGIRKWSVICETISVTGEKKITKPVTVMAKTENDANEKAKAQFADPSIKSVRAYSTSDLG